MAENKDLIQILTIIIIGMFIPLSGSLMLSYGTNILKIDGLIQLITTFIYFLIIFAVELLLVFLYFIISSKIADKKLEDYKPKK
ncbi:MAG: hypothetical protein V5A68_00060 [Candidatus Thermoplasmatota archaeon]